MLNIAVHTNSIVWMVSFVVVVHALGVALITFSWQLLLIAGSIFVASSTLQFIFGLITPQH